MNKLKKFLSKTKKITLGDCLCTWLAHYQEEKNLRPNTRANYYSYIHTHIIPRIGKIELSNVKPKMIKSFINELQLTGRVDKKGGLSVKTIREIMNVLNQALDYAVECGFIEFNQSRSVRLPREKKREVVVLKEEEQEKIEEMIDPNFMVNSQVAVKIGLHAGLRVGEICALTIGDIHLDQNYIRIDKTLGRVKVIGKTGEISYRILIGDAKTDTSHRIIPLTKELKEVIEIYLNTMPEHLKTPESPLFINSKGCAMEPRCMNYHFKKLLKQANVHDSHFHVLRHTFATKALEANMNIKTLSKIMGHANTGVTMDIYQHVSLQQMQIEMEKLMLSKAYAAQ